MGIIQNAINQTLGTAAIAARLDPGVEKRQQAAEDKKLGQKLEKQDIQLNQALDDLVNAPIPKGQTQRENAEYTQATALGILDELEKVRLQRAMRQEGAGFKGVLEVQGLRGDWTQEAIMKKANERSSQRNEGQNIQRDNFENFVNTVRNEAEVAAANRQNAFVPGAAPTVWQRGGK